MGKAVRPLGYEVNIDDTKDIIEALVNELVDLKAPYFRTYEEEKTIISLEIKILQALKRGRKKFEKVQKEDVKSGSPLLLIEGKGDDIEEEEGEEEHDEEEELEEKEPPKEKEKVIIKKPSPHLPCSQEDLPNLGRNSNCRMKRRNKYYLKRFPPCLSKD